MTPRIAHLCTLVAALAVAGCSGPDLSGVRTGPQAVHPSSSVAQPVAASASARQSEAKATFDTYCTPNTSNNDRVQAVINSGRFGEPTFGKLPVAGFEDVVFVFYTLKSGKAQIGFGARRMVENYCIAVDGTATGKELYIDGPAGRS